MKTKLENLLPKTVSEYQGGSLLPQSVRCGKSNCRCSSGELHSGYHYFFQRVHGRLVKTYVRKSDVPALTELIETARAELQHRSQVERDARRALQTISENLRQITLPSG